MNRLLGTIPSSVIVAVVLVACTRHQAAPRDRVERDGLPDLVFDVRPEGIRKADLLFVIDNSNSMLEEQAMLAAQVEVLIRELLRPTPDPVTGEEPPAIEDLHIGVVSTDMGTGGFTIMTCSNPMHGDYGRLWNVGQLDGCASTYSAADCPASECPWLSLAVDERENVDSSVSSLLDDFNCIATLGTRGCGFEQPMEAALVALRESSETGGSHEGFLREESALAVIFVTDEDDCSANDPELFNSARYDLGCLCNRCWAGGNERLLQPIDRYVETLRGVKPGKEHLITVAGIVGLPTDGTWVPGDPIEQLRELQQHDPRDPTQSIPVCRTEHGSVFPSPRIAELASEFGPNGVLGSICETDWSEVLMATARAIQRSLVASCLPRAVGGAVEAQCRVVEVLNDDRPCTAPVVVSEDGVTLGWHRDLGVDDSGQRRCEVVPADGPGAGWTYQRAGDDESETTICRHGEIAFVEIEFDAQSEVHVECWDE